MTPEQIKENNEVGKQWIDAGCPDNMLYWVNLKGEANNITRWSENYPHRIREDWKQKPDTLQRLIDLKENLDTGKRPHPVWSTTDQVYYLVQILIDEFKHKQKSDE